VSSLSLGSPSSNRNALSPVVLGRPGSGCSTFLKILANQRQGYHSVQGDIHFGAFTSEDIALNFRGDVSYCPEDDVHFPTLTVDETLHFAARTRAPNVLGSCPSKPRFLSEFVEVLSNVLGLAHVRQTVVGNEALRGVSGGEKKRVSVGEMLASRSVIGSWDK